MLIVLVGGAGFVIFSSKPSPSNQGLFQSSASSEKHTSQPAVEIVNPSGFVNTDDKPIKIADYVGKKVILLDILTYSCINCQRTFPYLTAWYDKYEKDGLIIIGIHTPEFAFEKDKKNVAEAMQKFGITFPIVLDNDYGTWNALHNQYWPHKYLIDIHGNIVYDHVGEGGYEETEEKIKELLSERAAVLGAAATLDKGLAASGITEEQTAARSPETYFGSMRNEYLGNGTKALAGVQTFSLPSSPDTNTLYLGGTWNISDESAEAKDTATVEFTYNAKEVYLVAESTEEGTVEVSQDGKGVEAEAGADAPAGIAKIKTSRLYKIVKNTAAGEHTLELKVSPGVRLFTFTFG